MNGDRVRAMLTELLMQTNGCICNLCGRGDKREVCEEIAEHLVENGVTLQQWIPATEPPKKSGRYIVHINHAKAATTLWYAASFGEWYKFDDKEYENPFNVTHWMPLPEPLEM